MLIHKTIVCGPGEFDNKFQEAFKEAKEYLKTQPVGAKGRTPFIDELNVDIKHDGNNHYILFRTILKSLDSQYL